MRGVRAWRREAIRSLACAFVLLAALVVPFARGGAADPQLQLKWQRGPLLDADGEPRSTAVLAIENHGAVALPPNGWSIYFTCLAEVVPAVATDTISVEHVNGTLYRLRPRPAFSGLPPGASADVHVQHEIAVHNPSLAPDGAYLVGGGAASVGSPIEITYEFGATQAGETTPAQLYERYGEFDPSLTAGQVPAVFPTPVSMAGRGGNVRWSSLPRIEAAPILQPEAAAARRFLVAYLATAPVGAARPGVPLLLRVAKLAGMASPEAYELRVDARAGVSITGNSPAGVARGVRARAVAGAGRGGRGGHGRTRARRRLSRPE